jgi:hypothetical protein
MSAKTKAAVFWSVLILGALSLRLAVVLGDKHSGGARAGTPGAFFGTAGYMIGFCLLAMLLFRPTRKYALAIGFVYVIGYLTWLMLLPNQ